MQVSLCMKITIRTINIVDPGTPLKIQLHLCGDRFQEIMREISTDLKIILKISLDQWVVIP